MALALAGLCQAATEPVPTPTMVQDLVTDGQFDAARSAIESALRNPSLDAESRRAYLWQHERMRRMLTDFTLDANQAKARIQKDIPDLKPEEFARWDTRGYLESMFIDGKKRYFRRGIRNLYLLSEEANARRTQPLQPSGSPLESTHPHHGKVRDAALASGKQHVLPKRFRITQTLTVDADAVPAGETLRAWIPYPQALPGQQEDIRYLSSQPSKHQIADAGTAQRTIYFEKVAQAGQPTVFNVSYELTIYAQYKQVDVDKVEPLALTPELEAFAGERPPHIVFTEQLRLFSEQIVGEETNPWRIAQKLYAAVDRIPWAGAREYSTIANLSDYALHAGHADCGQQTLLLMTLLRMNGIPTRWQSGAMFSPGDYWNIHDWGWLYIAPYGWLPMDVTFGRLDSDNPDIASFYLGGLDGYRIAFNSDYGRNFQPAKHWFRSDNVDSQRGEVEWKGGNLYYDQWGYDLAWQLLPATQDKHQDTTQPQP